MQTCEEGEHWVTCYKCNGTGQYGLFICVICAGAGGWCVADTEDEEDDDDDDR